MTIEPLDRKTILKLRMRALKRDVREGAEDEELGRRSLLKRDSGYDAEDERPCK